MNYSIEFYRSIVDSLTEHIVVIDKSGFIEYVNNAWIEFSILNECAIRNDWKGVNYLEVCDKAAEKNEVLGKIAA